MAYGGHASSIHFRKVLKIFTKFDVNNDGHLNREEMTALVLAVNPKVDFNDEQIAAILDEVFRTYGDYIDGDQGLSFDGLLQTYYDGAGDIDRDFNALGLELDKENGDITKHNRSIDLADEAFSSPAGSPPESPPETTRRKQSLGSWAESPTNGIVYESTWDLVDELETEIRELEVKMNQRRKKDDMGSLTFGWVRDAESRDGSAATQIVIGKRPWEDIGPDYLNFQKAVAEIWKRADQGRTQDEAYDAHMASGRILFDHRLYKEALSSFRRAAQIRPVKVKPHFQEGNTLFALGRITEAREAYNSALQAAEEDSDCLVPQIHVNLGIALESEGMLLGAIEHYKEAAIKEPKHYRALKLLGSALYGVGEYRAAKEALLEAISLNPDYADAHCELGSVLHALGDHDEASAEFERALELRPNHIEALYNLATLLKDIGRYRKAAMLYQKILVLQEDHWRAQLNRAVSLLGAGDIDESRRAFKEAYKMTGRSELYDAIAHLQQMENGHQGLLSFFKGGDTNFGVVSNGIMAKDNFIVVEPTRFRRVNAKTTPRQLLAFALDVRQFQKHTRFNRCDVSNLKRELSQVLLPNPLQQTIFSEKMIRKDALENIVHSLLSFLKPEAFQGAIKLVNERILLPIDSTASGRVDLGMVFSVFALICGGSLERRKRVAFDALVFRSPRTIDGEISNKDLKDYIKLLRIAYLRTKDEINSNHNVTEDHTTLSFPEFAEVLDDPDSGFGILNILSKLEMEDHVRHGRHLCAVCCYPITGPRFKETKVKFNLCSLCYSSGKVPSSAKHEENYHFKELNGETNTVKEKLQNYRQPFKSCLQE